MTLSIKGLALTVGIFWALVIVIVGIGNIVVPGYGAAFLEVVASIYPGYDVSDGVTGVVIGSLYGLLDGAVVGAIFAWLYNLLAG